MVKNWDLKTENGPVINQWLQVISWTRPVTKTVTIVHLARLVYPMKAIILFQVGSVDTNITNIFQLLNNCYCFAYQHC